MQCKFIVSWVGQCEVESTEDYCNSHWWKRCRCGAQATHDCDQTVYGMVCGILLCDTCNCPSKRH